MSKNNFIKMLKNYTSLYTEELEFRERMLLFVEQYENSFERFLKERHFTASAWLVNKDNTKALLMHHTKLDRWFQLGGHCDGDTDVLGVAIKEAQEESGIKGIEPVFREIFDIDIHRIPANKKEAAHDHYDVRFLLRVVSDEEVVQNRESKELRWIGKDPELLPTDNISVVRMFNKWLAR